ncbi:MAG: M14 family metallocarboxypeptidase [Puniceicoccaceae bacterium]
MNTTAFSDRLKEAARRAGFTYATYGEIGDVSLPVLTRHHADDAPEVYISAGVHGDEPAGPMAALELLRQKALPENINLTVFPLVNPQGLEAGTRENLDGVDLNRDYGSEPVAYETRSQLEWIGDCQYDVTICLHEDYDGEGFYVYAHSVDKAGPDFAQIAIDAASPFTGVDGRTEIDEMPAKNGKMFPPIDIVDPKRPDLPEALRLLFRHGAKVSVTTETPSCQPITKRIQAQCAVVMAVIQGYIK